MPKYNALVHNTVAKEIRETFQDALDGEPVPTTTKDAPWPSLLLTPEIEYQLRFTAVEVLAQIALAFAKRFAQDNAFFKPQEWLDQCSPDTQKYPLGELWQPNQRQ